MSYILEALRKSEQERRAGRTPALPALVAEQAPRRPRWPVWGLALMLALNGATLGYLWLHGRGKSRPEAEAGVPAPVPEVGQLAANGKTLPERGAAEAKAAPAPLDPPGDRVAGTAQPSGSPAASPLETKTAPVAHPPAPPQPVRAAKLPVAKPARPPAEPAARQVEATRSLARRAPAPAAGEGPAFAPAAARSTKAPGPLSRHANERDDASAVDESVPVPAAPAPRIVEEAERRAAGDAAIPTLGSLPAEVQQRIPPLKINLFAYSKVPAERFAIINMKRYAVGDSIPGGAELVEIRSDGLVLRLDGAKFQIPRP